ncbi:serine-threonine protein kinase, putative [Entamoeba dispar SAW760]|uniref:Serine-threonine protein kinase, putative n=1 Tax=Entamoeba dispar (strain ATCC PRA-260 / SAW760) TaxID=370354 RepID=B0ED09_ENTDS|nr:serine-threonine protein kinase, putative [Entamoeba dispar SAW760]EDR27426.1 serine-threonine protein kinase, putative [Entamoeba dispar SAW760]|eukprot:EDR27426.1 serine-threonine protein kinase, putative [Entamoeba dispar SAW760]
MNQNSSLSDRLIIIHNKTTKIQKVVSQSKKIQFSSFSITKSEIKDCVTSFLYEIPLDGFDKPRRVIKIFKELIKLKEFYQISFSKFPLLSKTLQMFQEMFLCIQNNNTYIITDSFATKNLVLLLICNGYDCEEFFTLFDKPINYDLTKYFGSDLAHLTQEYFSLQLEPHLPFFFKYPILFEPHSFVLEKDLSSPIKQVLFSPLSFVLPLLKDSSVFRQYIPSNLPYNYSKLTESVIGYSFGELLIKLKSNHPRRTNQTLNILIDKLAQQLKNIKKPIVCYLNNKFFVECYNYKDVVPVDLSKLGIYPEMEVKGNGAVGIVHRSKCGKYALKMCNPQKLASTLREVRVLRMLDHLNVLKFIAYSPNIIVTEWCYYGTLDNFIKQKNFSHYLLPLPYFFHFVSQFNNGMNYLLKDVQLVHRDIKYQNILITVDPNSSGPEPINLLLKIADFNTSREISDIMKTKWGTESMMAPEIKNGSFYTSKAEMVLIGLFLHFLLSGVSHPKPKLKIGSETIYDVSFCEVTRRINPYLYDSMYELISMMVINKLDKRIDWEEYLLRYSMIYNNFTKKK